MNGATTPPAVPRRLWWAADGRLRCTRHLPNIASLDWLQGGWQLVSADARRRLSGAQGAPAACSACALEARL